jgi:hypothetical protein
VPLSAFFGRTASKTVPNGKNSLGRPKLLRSCSALEEEEEEEEEEKEEGEEEEDSTSTTKPPLKDQLFIMDTWDRSQGSPFGICGGHSGMKF